MDDELIYGNKKVAASRSRAKTAPPARQPLAGGERTSRSVIAPL